MNLLEALKAVKEDTNLLCRPVKRRQNISVWQDFHLPNYPDFNWQESNFIGWLDAANNFVQYSNHELWENDIKFGICGDINYLPGDHETLLGEWETITKEDALKEGIQNRNYRDKQ